MKNLLADWGELKPATPFGELPLLTTPDVGDIGHELSILNYIGRKTALGVSSRRAVKPYFCTSLPRYLMRRICQSTMKEGASQPA